MLTRIFRRRLETVLQTADVRLLDPRQHDAARPWDIKLHDSSAILLIGLKGTLGLGETYMHGMWDSDELEETACRLMRSGAFAKGTRSLANLWDGIRNRAFNLQSETRAFIVGKEHYDLGNELFSHMLDRNMIYTCALWEDGAQDLEAAQLAKMDLLCRKLHLQPGLDLLDIGCGWGGFARYAAQNHGVRVVGLTVSKEQAEFARRLCSGLPVEIRLQDYRENSEKFDRVVSVEMIEAVGIKNLRTFFQVIHDSLRQDEEGKDLLVLQVIGRTTRFPSTEPWLTRYIFPNGMLPCFTEIMEATEGLFTLEHWQNITHNYVRTLESWWQNFEKHWPELRKTGVKFDQSFYRMWRYYLKIAKGGFMARAVDDSQYVFSKSGVKGGYWPSGSPPARSSTGGQAAR